MIDDGYEMPRFTPDLRTELARRLEELVPEVVADGKVDVHRLAELLGPDAATQSERFGLFWPGKRRAQRAAQEPTRATLKPVKEQSKEWETTKNVFIEGDNLEVLKILQRHYHRKVAMIYIDPPYNTGKDFVYPDNYADGLQTYLEFSQQVDRSGKRLSTNKESEGRYHSTWLSMMYPRLKLARNLLTSDGLIFVSIDDHEFDNLKKILDEVFGESNFVATLAVEMSKTQGMKVASAQNGQIVKNHEYILIYARSTTEASAHRQPLYDASELYDSHYDVVWEGGASTRTLAALLASDPVCVQAFERYRLRLGRSDLKKLLSIDAAFYQHFLTELAPKLYRESPITLDSVQLLDLPRDEVVRHEKYVLRRNSKGTIVQLQPFLDGVRTTDDYAPSRARATIRGALWKGFHSDMMNVGKEGGVEFKNGKKPVRLLKQLIKWVNRRDGIVLDFFAGSGTTAEAVVAMNAVDGGTRRYVLVQLPEPIDARRTVADITRRRLSEIDVTPRGNSGRVLDQGFRSFVLADSNLPQWKVSGEIDVDVLAQHLRSLSDNVWGDATEEDLLTELLLKAGYSLTEEVAQRRIAGLDVQSVGAGSLIVYLSEHKKPTLDQLDAVVADGPNTIIISESAFQGDDALRANLVQICKGANVELRTV